MSINSYVHSGSLLGFGSGTSLPKGFQPVEIVEIGTLGRPKEVIIYNGRITVYDESSQTLIDSGSIQTRALQIGALTFSTSIEFEPTDLNSLKWHLYGGADTDNAAIYYSDGNNYVINYGTLDIAGAEGAKTYIYYLKDTTTLQSTTTFSDAVGPYKSLLAIARVGATGTMCQIAPIGTDGAYISGDLIVTGTITGRRVTTSLADARVDMFPDANTGIVAYDNAAAKVFEVLVAGTDVGDVTIGNYAADKGAKWDKSAATFNVKGALTAGTGSSIDGSFLVTGSILSSKLQITGSNLIKNGSFESWPVNTDYTVSVPTYWSVHDGAGGVRSGYSDYYSYHGHGCMNLLATTTGAHNVGVAQSIADKIKPGKYYTYSVYLRAHPSGLPTSSNILIDILGTGIDTGGIYNDLRDPILTSTWTKYTLSTPITFASVPSDLYIRILLLVGSASVGQGILVDGFMLQECSSTTTTTGDYQNEGVTVIDGNMITTGKIKNTAGTVYFDLDESVIYSSEPGGIQISGIGGLKVNSTGGITIEQEGDVNFYVTRGSNDSAAINWYDDNNAGSSDLKGTLFYQSDIDCFNFWSSNVISLQPNDYIRLASQTYTYGVCPYSGTTNELGASDIGYSTLYLGTTGWLSGSIRMRSGVGGTVEGSEITWGAASGYTDFSQDMYGSSMRFFQSGDVKMTLSNDCVIAHALGWAGQSSWDSGNYLQGPNNSAYGAKAYAWNNYSDKRFKKVVGLVAEDEKLLEKICKLEPIYFNWESYDLYENVLVKRKDKEGNVEIDSKLCVGLLAQDVYEIFPEIVQKAKNENIETWGMSYDKLGVYAIAAIIKLYKRLIKLEKGQK